MRKLEKNAYINAKKNLNSLKHCVRSQITRLKLQKSFCDLEHGDMVEGPAACSN